MSVSVNVNESSMRSETVLAYLHGTSAALVAVPVPILWD